MKNKSLIITYFSSLLAVVFFYILGQNVKACPVNAPINLESKSEVISRFIQTTNKIANIDSANENAAEVFALYALLQEVFLHESMQSITISKQEQNLMLAYTNEIERLKEHNYYNSQMLKYSLNIYNKQCQPIILNQECDIDLILIKKIEEISDSPFSETQIYRMYILRKAVELYQLVGYYISDETKNLLEALLCKIRNHTISAPSLRDNRIITLMIQKTNPTNIKKRERANRNTEKKTRSL